MKQFFIDMMAAMMPFMKIPLWAACILTGLGVLLLILRFVRGSAPGLGLIGWLLVAIGGFFVGAQLMGMWLGMGPTINFGDPKKFEFNTVEFWKIGFVVLVPGIVLLLARPKA